MSPLADQGRSSKSTRASLENVNITVERVDGAWVFGGIERDSTLIKCFFLTVPDRSAATLIPLIKQSIIPSTTIYSDCWKAYSSLVSEGYVHNTVNHSIQFVCDNGTHTNNIESRWNAVKKSLPRFGTGLQKTIRWYHKLVMELILGTAVVNAAILYNQRQLEAGLKRMKIASVCRQ